MDRRPIDLLSGLIDAFIDVADRALYILVAAFFVIAATVLGVHAVIVFIQRLGKLPADSTVEQVVVTFVNALLLVLIILEVLSTVRDYLQRGTTSLTPFLYIGIISATRRILAIGAEAALQNGTVTNTDFRNHMIDLGVNGAVVLALALAVYLLRRGDRVEAHESARTAG